MPEPPHRLVEIPNGSRNDHEWDERLGGIKLERFSSVVHPTDCELGLQIVEDSRARWREASS